MLNHDQFKTKLLDYVDPELREELLPLIEKQMLDQQHAMKSEAISLVKGFFPDPHDGGDGCSDCLLIEALSETLEIYLPVKLEDEHE